MVDLCGAMCYNGVGGKMEGLIERVEQSWPRWSSTGTWHITISGPLPMDEMFTIYDIVNVRFTKRKVPIWWRVKKLFRRYHG